MTLSPETRSDREWADNIRTLVRSNHGDVDSEEQLVKACMDRPARRRRDKPFAVIEQELQNWQLDVDELEIHESLGSGSSCEVHRGTWRNKQVAVKILQIAKIEHQLAFEREFSTLQSAVGTSHSNLIQMFGVCTLHKPLQLVMEYCAGGTLFDILHEPTRQLAWPQSMKICLDVASAMEHLHSARPQIIHRDLKSLNVLLMEPLLGTDDMPNTKVSDFGLARVKSIESDDWQRMTNQAGTTQWMAPEVLGGQTYDEKVDVYSFAMLAYEIAWREIPFEDQDGSNLANLVMQGRRPPHTPMPEGCPAEIPALVKMCWHQDPSKRPDFATVKRFLKAVSVERGCGDRWKVML